MRLHCSQSRQSLSIGLSALLLWSVACADSDLFGNEESHTVVRERPNVVLISVDTLRADALGSYGSPSPTPFIDALAERGVLFERAYAPAALTAPSHATLFTGREPLDHGITRNGVSLQAEIETLAEQFRAAGYASGAFVSSFVLDPRFGWDQGFDVFDAQFSKDDATVSKELAQPGMFFNMHTFEGFDRRADATVDAALAWLATAEEPYFLFVHLFDPHDPYVPPEAYLDRLKPAKFDLKGRTAPGARKPRRLERLVRRYHAEVLFADHELGRLFDGLEAKSDRRSVTALTSDHGEGLGQHDWLVHARNLYDEAVHVPLIVSDSAASVRGKRLRTPVGVVDVAPTLLGLAGLSELSSASGRSLAKSVEAGSEPEARPVFAHRRPHPTATIDFRGEKISARDADAKWISNDLIEDEFYDLANDPGELNDLVGTRSGEPPSAEQTERGVALLDLINSHRAEAGVIDEPPELAPDVRAALDALGYTE